MSILGKMKLKSGPALVLGLPADLKGLFSGVEVKVDLKDISKPEQVVLFAADKASISKHFLKIRAKLTDDAVLWIAYPKKSGKIKSDITRDNGWEDLTGNGYIPVTQVAVNEDWSALRFRKEVLVGPKVRDTKMEDRRLEGIDFVNRKVTLPADVKAALKPFRGLTKLLEEMSFTHQKEYVEYIVTAKKPETRQRRIDKTIMMLEDMLNKQKK